MSRLASVAALVIGIAAVLTFYTALLHLNRTPLGNSYKFRILRDLIVGWQALMLYFIARGLQFRYPLLIYPFVTLLFVAGPLNYIRYYMFFYPGGKIPSRFLAQLVPAALVLALETWFYFAGPGRKPGEMAALFADPLVHPASAVLLVGLVVVLVQYVQLLRLELGFRNSQKIRQPVLISSSITGLYMVATILIAAGFFLVRPPVLQSGILLLGLTVIIYLFFENRYPQFYQLVAQEERQQKYRKSVIQGLSRDKILERLRQLMEEEKIYRDLELRLDDVAAKLFITPHQLSEFVNDQLGVSFPAYVNQHRVAGAKELLLANPDQSTLSVGFEVGFGSKQSFNTSFKQLTGMTPSEYRKKHIPGEKS